jgi:hypothetical protein
LDLLAKQAAIKKETIPPENLSGTEIQYEPDLSDLKKTTTEISPPDASLFENEETEYSDRERIQPIEETGYSHLHYIGLMRHPVLIRFVCA